MNRKRFQSVSEDGEDSEEDSKTDGSVEDSQVKKRRIHPSGDLNSGKKKHEKSSGRKNTSDDSISENKKLDRSKSSKETPVSEKMISNSNDPSERLIMKTLFEESEESERKTESSSSEEDSAEDIKEKNTLGNEKERDKNPGRRSKKRACMSSDSEDSDDDVSDLNSKNESRSAVSSYSSDDEKSLKSIADRNKKGNSLAESERSNSVGSKRKRKNKSESLESESSENEIKEKKKLVKDSAHSPVKKICEENISSGKLSRKKVAKTVNYDSSSSEEDGDDTKGTNDKEKLLNNSEKSEKEEGSSDTENSSESEDGKLSSKENFGKKNNRTKNQKSENLKIESASLSSDDERPEDGKSRKGKSNNASSDGQQSKKPSAGEKKLLRMKRFVLLAGVRIKNYNTFFTGCKSTTAKVKRLQDLLDEKGLKGNPTIEKCKKLRKKLEKQREIAELDLSNIIEGGGRSRRSRDEPKKEVNNKEEAVGFKQRFSRIKDIVSSESD